MAKTSTRARLAKNQLGDGVRSRDAEIPGAPVHVTGDAQAMAFDVNTGRQFERSRTEQNRLPERPSTSGGTATGPSMRRDVEKRETRDDLHFNPLGAHATGTSFRKAPLSGQPPTLSTSPPDIRTSSLVSADTFDSIENRSANLNVPQTEIGMALGSPTHPPNDWRSQSSMTSSIRNETPNSMDTYFSSDVHVSSKQKGSKWKLFGGLFGGNKKSNLGSPQAFYQLQPEGAVVTTMGEADYTNFGEPAAPSLPRSKTRERGRTNPEWKHDKHNPGVKRAQTAPTNFDVQNSSKGTGMARAPMITLDGGPLDVHPGKKHFHGGPMLDVDIPSVQMERYSIMFGSVLQKTPASSSSLLARRQATLDKLRTVNEALAVKEKELEERAKLLRPRRATSPQPMKSPAFSLFPSTPSRLNVREASPASYRRSPLQRSNTSPAALSPSLPTFPLESENEKHANLTAPGPHVPIVAEPQGERSGHRTRDPKPAINQTATAPPKPQSPNHNWSLEESHLALDSPSSYVSEVEIYDPSPLPMRPKLNEPVWQIINPQQAHIPTPSASGSISSASENSTLTSASSISTTSMAPFTTSNVKTVKVQAPPPKLRSGSTPNIPTLAPSQRKDSKVSLASSSSPSPSAAKKPLDIAKRPTEQDDLEQRLKTAADVSIARQITISRQQRQLLTPVRGNTNTNTIPIPHPLYTQNLSPLNTVDVIRSASPLGAVASAARTESPVDRHGRAVAERKASKRAGTKERLVTARKPSMPTLVVVGNGEEEKVWSGKAVEQLRGSTSSGEIRVGLAVDRNEIGGWGRSGLSPGDHVQGHMYRNSEMVVVERVGLASPT